jgi:hypothetical protein
MVNLPQVVTDAVPSQSLPIATEATTTASEISTGIVLPDNYQAMSVSNDAVHKGNLILVNKDNPCMLTKENLDLQQVSFSTDKPDTYEVSYPGHTFLDKTALSKFNRLMKAYYGATTNSEIMFNYGWLEAGKEKSNPESPTALDVQLMSSAPAAPMSTLPIPRRFRGSLSIWTATALCSAIPMTKPISPAIRAALPPFAMSVSRTLPI